MQTSANPSKTIKLLARTYAKWLLHGCANMIAITFIRFQLIQIMRGKEW